MDKIFLEAIRQKLKKEQARLRAALSTVTKGEKFASPKFEEMGSDMEASQDETEQYEANFATEQELEPMLFRIEHALDKIQKDIYGVCEKCGNDIPVERLQAAPEAEFCVEHEPS